MVDQWAGPERINPSRMREEAERRLAAASALETDRTPEQLLHELQVHQVELEMQNETLRQAQLDLEESRDRYVDLYEFAPVGYVILTREGLIAEANLTATTLLGVERSRLLQRRFTLFVTPEDRERWQRLFVTLIGRVERQNFDLLLQRGEGSVFHARLDCLRMHSSSAFPLLRVAITDIEESKQAELALIKSESLLRAITDNSNALIFVKDLAGRYLFLNRQYETMFKVSNGSALGKTDNDIFPQELANIFITNDQLVFRSGQLLETEEQVPHGDNILTYHTLKFPLRDDAGKIYAVCGIATDISARRAAAEHMHQLSLAVEQSPASIMITDPHPRIEYVNPAFTTITGYSAAEALGQNPSMLKSGRTPAETYKELWSALHAGKIWRGQLINRRKDGAECIEMASISPLFQEDGRVTHFVAVQEDITELKQIMAELRLNNDRLRLAKSASGLGVYDYDMVGDKIELDIRTRELWGVGSDEPITYAAFMAGIKPEDREATQVAIDRARDPHGNGNFYIEYRVISHADGSQHHLAANGKVSFEDGHAVRLIGTVRDITVQKKMEAEVKERRSEMELLVNQQVAAQTAAAIAHEMNQPLTSVSAYSEAALNMLRGGSARHGKLERALEGAVEQSQRAGRTLHELLEFLHKGEVVIEPTDLNGVVRDALSIAEESGYGGFHLLIRPDLSVNHAAYFTRASWKYFLTRSGK